RRLPAQLAHYGFDWVAYFQNVHFGLQQIRAQAGEFPELVKDEREFEACLAQQPADLQREVRSYIANAPRPQAAAAASPLTRLRMKLSLLRTAVLLRLLPLTRDTVIARLSQGGLSVRAHAAGIPDILEFSRFAGGLLEGLRPAGKGA